MDKSNYINYINFIQHLDKSALLEEKKKLLNSLTKMVVLDNDSADKLVEQLSLVDEELAGREE